MKTLKYKKPNIALKAISLSFIFTIILSFALPLNKVDAGTPCKTGPNDPPNCDVATCTGPDKPYRGCLPPKTEGGNTPIPTEGGNSGTKIQTGLENPLKNAGINELPDLIVAILKFVLTIGIPIITLAIIYSGFLFVTAQGNQEKLKTAKKAILYTIIGAALLLGSYVIANAIKGTVDQVETAAKQ